MFDREIYFHIGLHRTATTFLQTKFFPDLIECNFINHFEIYRELINLTTTDEYMWNETNLKDQTKREIESKFKDRINIISAECLTGFPFLKSINRSIILNRIKTLFPNAKIILGIREQKAIIQSLYFLYIREGGTLHINDLIKKKDKNYFGYTIYDNLIETIDLDAFKYNILIQELFDLFGEENVYVFVLEEFKDNNKSINKLISFLGLSEFELSRIKQKKVNKSYPYNSLEMIRWANKFTKGFSSKGRVRSFQKRFINKIFKRIFKDKSEHIYPEIDVNLYEYFLSDNRKLSNLLPSYSEYFINYNNSLSV